MHTDIAQQTKGPGIFAKHAFRLSERLVQDQDRSRADYAMGAQDAGDSSIAALSVSIAGLSVPLSLNSSLPLQPGGSVSGTSVISLQELPLVLGAAFPVTVTATFIDGVSVTNSTLVTYTLP